MTTVDPPELVRFVICQFEAVIYDLPDGSFKYFAVNSDGKLLSPATAQGVTGKRCIHFTIPKLSMRQLPPCAAPRPERYPNLWPMIWQASAGKPTGSRYALG